MFTFYFMLDIQLYYILNAIIYLITLVLSHNVPLQSKNDFLGNYFQLTCDEFMRYFHVQKLLFHLRIHYCHAKCEMSTSFLRKSK